MAPRIEPATLPYPPDVQATFDRLSALWDAPTFRLFTTLARDPRLLKRTLAGAPIYFDDPNVPIRPREILLHRTTGRAGCFYEWGMRAHYYAGKAGLTDEQLRSTVLGSADDACWDDDDRLVFRLADELFDSCNVSDELWTALSSHFSAEAMIEMLLLAGYYRTIAYLANSLRLPPEPDVCRPLPTN